MDGSSAQTETSTTLLRGISEGDQSSWVRFVEKYHPRIVRRCREMGLSVQDSENLSQEIFFHLFKRVDEFKRQRPGSFRRWLSMMLRSRVIDSYRRKKLPMESPENIDFVAALLPVGTSEDSEVSKQLLKRILSTIQSKFQPRDWTIFYLIVGEERPVKEVALALGVSENVVYLCKSRVLKKIQTLYELKDGQLIEKDPPSAF